MNTNQKQIEKKVFEIEKLLRKLSEILCIFHALKAAK